jgi:hypothetical protein
VSSFISGFFTFLWPSKKSNKRNSLAEFYFPGSLSPKGRTHGFIADISICVHFQIVNPQIYTISFQNYIFFKRIPYKANPVCGLVCNGGLTEFFKLHALCFSMSKCQVSFQGSLLFFGRQRKVTKETLSLNFCSDPLSIRSRKGMNLIPHSSESSNSIPFCRLLHRAGTPLSKNKARIRSEKTYGN